MKLPLAALAFASALCAPPNAQAHASSQAYLSLRGDAQHAQLRVDVALRDLDAALDLDTDGDAQITWGEVRQARAAIQRYIAQGVALSNCPAPLMPEAFQLEERGDGVYAAVTFNSPCATSAVVALGALPTVRYTLLGTIDPTHRALLKTQASGAAPQLHLLNPLQPIAIANTPPQAQDSQPGGPPDNAPILSRPSVMNTVHTVPAAIATLPALATPASIDAPASFWLEGVRHLVTGYDHMLFLLCLLLPAVLTLERRPVATLRAAVLPVLGIVTAFTVAHSITLALATLGVLSISSRVIEPLIAISIVLTAVDNLKPFLSRSLHLPRWAIAAGFGLVHGFGFAGVLAEMELPPATLAWALLQFNLGLEAAQVGVVTLAVSLLYALRRWAGYDRWVLSLGSAMAAGVGALWVVQRVA